MSTAPERIAPVLPPRPYEPATAVPSIGADDETAAGLDALAARSATGRRRDDWLAAIPARFAGAVVSDLPIGPIRTDLDGWIADDERGNLLLFGDVGVGKTHAAVAAARALYGQGAGVEFSPVGELLDRLDWRRPDSAGWLDRCCTVDLLIVDDLGSERSNEWTGERLYAIVNRRWLERRPIIVTTNLPPAYAAGTIPEPLAPMTLEEAIGTRSYSRLRDGSIALMLDGDDRRQGA